MLAQYIFDQIINTSNSNKVKLKLFKFLRTKLLSSSEPTVNYQFGNYNLEIYLSHDFPFNLKEKPQYSQNLGVIAEIISKKYPNLQVIDVGANVGDSAAIIKNKVNVPILCIEGNPRFLGLLEKNTASMSDIQIEKCFVGEEELTVTPINSLGTSYLEKSENGIPVKTISSIIEKNERFSNVKLLKIDTDGFDNKIIRGAEAFLRKTKSSVFFEYDPHYLSLQGEKGVDIFDFLVSLEYEKFVIFDNLGDQLITLSKNNKKEFVELHNFFNRGSSRYMDIWAIHSNDVDLI
ncbi:MAG: FkbM family methyltransferase [Bacteroidia bacterium]|nr:FkbM family methyltransferase [Bacteroidia bacterium]MCF8425703.1 FkbM family methyltransferase [Bacteroidia bacterium]MCF8446003.1 FkbM family methyltransferase [Bacteroidia bacterium]